MAVWSQKLSGWKYLATVAVSLVGAIAGAVALAGPVAGPSAGVVALAGALAFNLPWYVALVLSLGLYFSLIWLYDRARLKVELAAYWFIYSLFFLTGSLALLNWIESTNIVLLLLFYLILPLVNTPLDWLSLGITRALLQSIRFNQHRFGKALLWSVLDLGLAVIALLLVSGVTVAVVSLANLLAVKPFIDLQVLFTSLGRLESWRDNLWIYFMLLSTLVPTAIHFALAGGALTLAVSDKQRRVILKDMDSNDLNAKKAWIYVSVMPAFGFVLAPTLLLFGLYWLLHAHAAFLGNALLSWAELLATWIDPTLGGSA